MRYLVHRPTSVGLFDNFDRLFGTGPTWTRWVRHTPLVDVHEEKDRYVLEAELPGVTARDIEVSISDSQLTISSKASGEKEKSSESYLIHERSGHGLEQGFERSFRLPDDASSEKVEATFANGILRLEIAKTAESQPRSIEVKSVALSK